MKRLVDLTTEQLNEFESNIKKRYDEYLSKNITLNMARGKPSPEQLDLSNELFSLDVDNCGYCSSTGEDCRNYGELYGIKECRQLFGDILGMPAKNVIVCGNSSLNLMFDYIAQCSYKGINGCAPWLSNPNRKFIAIVPGYDRHFAIAEYFGLKMVNVPMTKDGPNMDLIEEIIKDEDVKGIFCVPKYSNPDGITYSNDTVRRFASLKPAAKDFRVIWDNAYAIHGFEENDDVLLNIFEESKKYGNEDLFIQFTSTSKITFAGAGVSAMAASDKNFDEIVKRLTLQIISYDKINQLRHANLFKSINDIKIQMEKHAEILRPKFKKVLDVLNKELTGLEIATWNEPKGGYFISLDINIGSAKYVGELCKNAGLTLTNVGATFPYGIDPDDKNIRLAPSYPSVEELNDAAEIVCLSVILSACKAIKEKVE